MNNLNNIKVFVRVAESRSFTAAAQRLGSSASGVSKSVSRLEDELGVRLFNRTTRNVRLTEDGVSFLERCRQILVEIEEAESALTLAHATPRGKLRVQIPAGFGRKVIVPKLADFAARYPELVVEVELSDRIVDLGEEGLDVVVRIGELPDARLVVRKLYDIRYVTCAAPEYLRLYGEPTTPHDLDRHRCLVYVSAKTGRLRNWRFAHNGKQFARAVSCSLGMNSVESLLDAAIAGAGIVTVGSYIAADAVASGKLKVVLQDYIADGPTIWVAYLPSRHRSSRVRAFIDFLNELVPPAPPWDRMMVSNRSAAGEKTPPDNTRGRKSSGYRPVQT